MTQFYEQHKSVQPFLINDAGDKMDKEHYQSKEDRSKLDGARCCLLPRLAFSAASCL
jgi:succinate dehydrogenase/fumarate reductase-like Fe-S protein